MVIHSQSIVFEQMDVDLRVLKPVFQMLERKD